MYKEGACLYRNPLRSASDVKDWRMEGGGQVSFEDHRMHLSHVQDEAHFVYWCPETFPGGIIVKWDFYPIEQPGLCMLFSQLPASEARTYLTRDSRKEQESTPNTIPETSMRSICRISAENTRRKERSAPAI